MENEINPQIKKRLEEYDKEIKSYHKRQKNKELIENFIKYFSVSVVIILILILIFWLIGNPKSLLIICLTTIIIFIINKVAKR